MKPEEVDFTQTFKPYFDLSTGEVLADRDERQTYLAEGGDPACVVPLGALLRYPDLFVEPGNFFYEKQGESEWPEEKSVEFARWIAKVVDPPESRLQANVTSEMFRVARRLGFGPSEYVINTDFGSYSKLYAEARLKNTRMVKVFDDWGVNDVVAYLKKIGNGSRPTKDTVIKRHRNDPNNPAYSYLHERFHDIGGFSKLVELAGYPVIKLWDRSDYIEWGVRFMVANDGKVPSGRAMSYLSAKKKGPNTSTVFDHFGSVPAFQSEVVPRFYERQAEEAAAQQQLFDELRDELEADELPTMLFSPFAYDTNKDAAAFTERVVQTLYDCEHPLERIMTVLSKEEITTRYAKFKVLRAIAPNMTAHSKIKIARGVSGDRVFAAAIRKMDAFDHITTADVESEALFLGVFDYIWPMDEYKEELKLGEEYDEIIRKENAVRRARRASKLALKAT